MSTILFADDTVYCREPIAAMLRGKGYKVVCACNGREALEALPQCAPDLVLLDVPMPEMDGLTFLARARSDPRWAELPVLLLSATTEKEHADRALALGVRGHLVKSRFSLAELLRSIESCLTGAVTAHPAPVSATKPSPIAV